MKKHYLSKSALLLSLIAASGATGLVYADESPAATPTATVQKTAATTEVAIQNQAATATPTGSTPNATVEASTNTTATTSATEVTAIQTNQPISVSETSNDSTQALPETSAEPNAPAQPTPTGNSTTTTTVNDSSAMSKTATAPQNLADTSAPNLPTEGQSVELRILSTTDLHTNLVNYDYYQDKPSQTVGLAKTALLIEDAKKENGNTILVDSGDTIQGTPFGTYEALINPVKEGQTHPMYKAFEKLGYDAETLGNHEFNYGLDFLNRMVNTAGLPIVNANVRDAKTGDYYFTPYKIIEKPFADTKGQPITIKVGITGVLPPQIMVWDKANLEGKVTVDDPVKSVEKLVPVMKNAGADIILALAHSGIGDDEYQSGEENEGYFLASIDGVDAVATGHSHANFPNGDGSSFYAKYKGVDDINGLINGKPVVMAGKFGDHLGIMDMTLTYKENKWQVIKSKSQLRKIDSKSDAADQELIDLVKDEHQGTISYVRQEVGQTTAPINSYFAQVLDDPSIQIVNNAQVWYAKQQLAGTADANLPIISAAAPFKAGTRGDATYYTDIPAGPLAIKNVADLYLYDNVTALIKLTGAQIKEWLEMSAGQFNQIDPNSKAPQQLINSNYRSYNYDVLDGLTYQFDITQPNKYDFEGKLVNPDASRVRNLQYQGKAIDPNQTFIVVSNNYRATGNFPGVRDAAEKRLLNLENRQVIIDYIVSEKIINPSADGNWSFTDNSLKDLDIRFLSSENAQKYLAAQSNIKYLGSSSSEGFGEYQLLYTEKSANLAEKTEAPINTEKQSQSSNIYNLVAKAYAQTQAATTTQTAIAWSIQASTSHTNKASALPNTSSTDSSVLSFLGFSLLGLAGFFTRKIKH